jgi:ATP:ADP antiporter, AAA family
MPERDPFPMTSPEAKRLEESVALAGDARSPSSTNSDWSSMQTEVEHSNQENLGIVGGDDEGEASSSLVAKKRKQLVAGGDDDDIYKEVDLPEEDHDEEDAFLDVPLSELRGTKMDRWKGSAKRASLKLYRRLYGEKLPPSEMLRVLTLASTLFFMIGGYWLMRSLKDPVLMALCGYRAIPKAKMLSVFVVLGVVSVYNRFLDSDIPKHKLFYIFGTFYFALFSVIALCLMDPHIGLANKHASESRILGWVSYCSIESYGSVMVSLFWSFANSNIELETAKASYGVMVALAQVGSILGPAFVNRYGETWGPAKCYLLGAAIILLLQVTMYNYIRVYGSKEQREKDALDPNAAPVKKKASAGVTEGLVLFWKHNYVKGIFAISCMFMIAVTIVDFTLKVLANDFFSKAHPCEITNLDCYDPVTQQFGLTEEATNAMTAFMGLFGVATNSLSFTFSLLGTSAVIRYLGLRLTLLLFPSLCLLVIIFVRLHPTLYVVFGAMIILKANSYALNNPTKELLYQPTSPAVRYKAKSWIDIFGARGSKAAGSIVTNAFSYSAEVLVSNGTLVGMAVASFLIWNARFMGQKFEEYTESGYIVGDENNPESKNIEMAIGQNLDKETSCAIYDDNEDEEDGGGEEETKDEERKEDAVVARV